MSRHQQHDPPQQPLAGYATGGYVHQRGTDPEAYEANGPMYFETPAPPVAVKKRRHVFRWVFLAVQALFLVWIITGASSGTGTPAACKGMAGQALKTCQDAGHAGTAIGVFMIVVIWACVDVVLALGWLVFRKRS